MTEAHEVGDLYFGLRSEAHTNPEMALVFQDFCEVFALGRRLRKVRQKFRALNQRSGSSAAWYSRIGSAEEGFTYPKSYSGYPGCSSAISGLVRSFVSEVNEWERSEAHPNSDPYLSGY